MVIRFLSSVMNSLGWLFHTPAVSIAIGVNRWVCKMLWYFWVLETADLSAACPTFVAVVGRCDCAQVSGIVTSYARHLPGFHRISVTPSGRLLSLPSRPGGFFTAGIFALCIALQMMSLTMFADWSSQHCGDMIDRGSPTFYMLPTGTEMSLAYIDAESHSNGDADVLTRHSLPHCSDRWRQKSISRMWRCSCSQTPLIQRTACVVEKFFRDLLCD